MPKENLSRLDMLVLLTSKPHTKITHRLFDANEYIYLGDDGLVHDESGRIFDDWDSPHLCGLRERSGGVWETGWSRYDK